MASLGPGNWFGLPEFGLTELMGGKTYSLGQAQQRANSSASGNVLGTTTKTSTQPSASYGTPASYSSAPSASRDIGTGFNVQQAQDDQEEADRNTRDSIKDRYESYKGELDRLAGFIPQWQTEDTNNINNSFGYAGEQLGIARDNAMNKLDLSRGQVEQNTSKSINDLQQNLRNMMKATSMQLGAMGAGDSSASQVMAPYAYAKLGSQNRNQVLDQRNTQLNDVNMKEQDVVSVYDTEKVKLDKDKADALANIQSFYRDKLMTLESQKANAKDAQKEAISNLQMGILQEATQNLRTVQSYIQQRNDALDNWARDRLAQSEAQRQYMDTTSNYTAQEIDPGNVPGMTANAGFQNADYTNNGINWLKKKNQQALV